MRILFAVVLLAFSSVVNAQGPHWVGAWATAPVAVENKIAAFSQDTTLREIVHVSLGGSALRVVFSNEFGLDTLTLGGATVALSAGNAASTIVPSTLARVTFLGRPGIAIPPGAVAVSDPVSLALPPEADLAISVFVPTQPVRTITLHGSLQHSGSAFSTQFEASGNQVAATSLSAPTTIQAWQFLKAVEVQSMGQAVVAFGDSITDGAHSSLNANARWPDVLAARLRTSGKPLGVLNEGIGGNRILHDGTGVNALARFDRDVLAQDGVRFVILLEGINDIGHGTDLKDPYDVVSADDLIAGLTQLARRTRAHGLKVFGATLTPYAGAPHASPAGEAMREDVNRWIRTSPEFDGVIDFDAATRDPAHPAMLLPAYDCGDHLHPNDAGYKAMGEAIDLKLFR